MKQSTLLLNIRCKYSDGLLAGILQAFIVFVVSLMFSANAAAEFRTLSNTDYTNDKPITKFQCRMYPKQDYSKEEIQQFWRTTGPHPEPMYIIAVGYETGEYALEVVIGKFAETKRKIGYAFDQDTINEDERTLRQTLRNMCIKQLVDTGKESSSSYSLETSKFIKNLPQISKLGKKGVWSIPYKGEKDMGYTTIVYAALPTEQGVSQVQSSATQDIEPEGNSAGTGNVKVMGEDQTRTTDIDQLVIQLGQQSQDIQSLSSQVLALNIVIESLAQHSVKTKFSNPPPQQTITWDAIILLTLCSFILLLIILSWLNSKNNSKSIQENVEKKYDKLANKLKSLEANASKDVAIDLNSIQKQVAKTLIETVDENFKFQGEDAIKGSFEESLLQMISNGVQEAVSQSVSQELEKQLTAINDVGNVLQFEKDTLKLKKKNDELRAQNASFITISKKKEAHITKQCMDKINDLHASVEEKNAKIKELFTIKDQYGKNLNAYNALKVEYQEKDTKFKVQEENHNKKIDEITKELQEATQVRVGFIKRPLENLRVVLNDFMVAINDSDHCFIPPRINEYYKDLQGLLEENTVMDMTRLKKIVDSLAGEGREAIAVLVNIIYWNHWLGLHPDIYNTAAPLLRGIMRIYTVTNFYHTDFDDISSEAEVTQADSRFHYFPSEFYMDNEQREVFTGHLVESFKKLLLVVINSGSQDLLNTYKETLDNVIEKPLSATFGNEITQGVLKLLKTGVTDKGSTKEATSRLTF